MTVELKTPYVSKELAAIVVDPSNTPIPGANVKLMTQGWKSQVESTKTNFRGFFRFKQRRHTINFLEITCPGFQVMHVKLKIVKGRKIWARITAEIAT